MRQWIVLAALLGVLLGSQLGAQWKWVSGPLLPGRHTHGSGLARVYHLWVGDGWSGATYTCSVPRFMFETAQGWVSCVGRYGRQ